MVGSSRLSFIAIHEVEADEERFVQTKIFQFYHPWYYHSLISLHTCRATKKSPSGSANVSRKIGFEERKAEDLLKNSISIPYPDGKIFTPTALSNDGIAYGEAVDQGHLSNLLSRPRYTCTGSNLWRLDETDTRGIIRSHGYMQ